MKKILSIVLVTVLTLSSLFTASSGALANSDKPLKEDGFVQTKDTKEHEVYKFSNGEKLEKFNKESKEFYVADTGKEKVKIYKENETVFVVDLVSEEVIHTINLETEVSPSESINDSLVSNSFKETSSVGPGTLAVVNDPGTGSKYKFVSTRHLSLAVFTTSVSILAGVIASFVATPVTGAIVTIATGSISYGLPHIYWKRHVYQYTEGIYRYTRWINQSYKYHDYTGYLGVAYSYTKSRVGI